MPVFLNLILLPFFEGGETALGLFLVHSIVLIALAGIAFYYSKLAFPRLVIWLPYLAILALSTVFSPYKFASFLKFWDFTIAGLWAVLVCTVIENHRQTVDRLISWIFIGLAASTITAILLYNTREIMRISASFLNPNDYASFALVLVCFGVYCHERETQRSLKTAILTLLIILLLSLALSFSRGIFIAIIALLVIVFLKHRPSKAILGILMGLVLISGIMITLRLRMYEDPLQYYRLKIWKSSLQGLFDSPYMGIGLGMLEHRANQFNFPGETEIGRFKKIARTADNQYVQTLAETGFLGFFAFLLWWIGLGYAAWKFSPRYFYLGLSWVILTVTGLFSLPLENTSVLFLFIFLIVFGETMDQPASVKILNFGSAYRVIIPVGCFLLFAVAVYFPYIADREFHLAAASRNQSDAEKHLAKALRYNPYQPYYRFYFIRPLVDAKPELSKEKWMSVVAALDETIALNPEEYEFYLYKARVLRNLLLQDSPTLESYSAAISSYQNALDCNPYNVFLRLEFASFLTRVGRFDLAVSEAQKCLELEPAFLNGRLFLAEMLFKVNRTREAKDQYEQFKRDSVRYQKELAYAPSPYIRQLLTVNQKQKQRLEELTRPS